MMKTLEIHRRFFDYLAAQSLPDYPAVARREHSAWELHRKQQTAVTAAGTASAGERKARKRSAGFAPALIEQGMGKASPLPAATRLHIRAYRAVWQLTPNFGIK